MNLNSVTIVGRMTRDPEARALPSGSQVANFSVATSRTWKQEGEKKEETEFHNVVAFGKLAEIINQYLKKGQLVMIQGRLKTSSWEKDGAKKYKTEIIAEQMQMGPKAAGSSRTPSQGEEDQTPPEDINPDDVPF